MAVLITATGPTALRSYVYPDQNAKMLTSAQPVLVGEGGTGFATYTTGDLLVASSALALAKLPAGAAGAVLTSGGPGVVPAWAAPPPAPGAGSIIPATDNAFDLGSAALRWRNIYAAGFVQASAFVANAAAELKIGTIDNQNVAFYSNNVRTWVYDFTQITPGGDNTINLGSPSARWKNLYAAAIASGPITAGAITAGDITVNSLTLISAGYLGFVNRSYLDSPANGNFKMTDRDGTSFGLLQFGGVTAAYPALKRVGGNLFTRAADDSGNTGFGCANLFLNQSGAIIAAAQGQLTFYADGTLQLANAAGAARTRWSGSGGLLFVEADLAMVPNGAGGVLFLGNAANSDFNRIQLGGTGATAPAIKKSGATVQVKLADDSAFAEISAVKFNLSGTGGGLEATTLMAGATAVVPAGGGAYFGVGAGTVFVNSSRLVFANGGSPFFVIAAPTVDGQTSFLSSTGIGIGLDVAADGLLKIRTRAQTAGGGIEAATLALGINPATAGALRLANSAQFMARNGANSANLNIALLDVNNALYIGDASGNTLLQGGTSAIYSANLGAPPATADGFWWVEATGVSPARQLRIAVRDGGVIYYQNIGAVH